MAPLLAKRQPVTPCLPRPALHLPTLTPNLQHVYCAYTNTHNVYICSQSAHISKKKTNSISPLSVALVRPHSGMVDTGGLLSLRSLSGLPHTCWASLHARNPLLRDACLHHIHTDPNENQLPPDFAHCSGPINPHLRMNLKYVRPSTKFPVHLDDIGQKVKNTFVVH